MRRINHNMQNVSARGSVCFSVAQLLSSHMPKPRYQEPTIRQSKNGSFYIRPYIDILSADGLSRKKKTIVLGPASIGKREAIRLKNAAMEKINRADYIIQSQIRLGDFVEHYDRAHVATLSASTQAKYRSHLKNHILPSFGKLMLCEVSTSLVAGWLQEKERAGMSWAARADIRNILSGVFTKAADWGHWQDRNPIEAVSPGRKRAVREKRKLTDEQTRRLLAALPCDVRLMCCTGLFCTLRVSEMLGLLEKNLNFDTNQIQVRQRYYRGNTDIPKNEKATRDVSDGLPCRRPPLVVQRRTGPAGVPDQNPSRMGTQRRSLP